MSDILWISHPAEHGVLLDGLDELGVFCGRPALLNHVGLDKARRHGVDGDAVRAQLHGESPRQSRNRRLGGGVKRATRQRSAVAGNRSKVHDAPIAAVLHAGHRRARDIDQSIDIRTAHAFHAGGIESLKRGTVDDSGVVHQYGI